MSDYEPPKEECDALANEFLAAYKRAPYYGEVARFVLRRQHERESGLLEALRSIERMNYIGTPGRVCSLALAAHAKLDAPKVPTLLEAAQAAIEDCGDPDGRAFHGMVVSVGAWLALKDAVERAEKDAPKMLTVLDAAKACVRASCGKGGDEIEALRALKAAVEREERK